MTAEVDSERFRKRIRAELEESCPPSMRTKATAADQVWGGSKQIFSSPDAKGWLEAAAARGWTAPTWPEEYGGAGMTAAEARVLHAEMSAIRARQPLLRLTPGLSMLGPVLLEHGTPEQRARFLPSIVRGETRWCQGYSEPSAGLRPGQRQDASGR